jgi:hypothetical protein
VLFDSCITHHACSTQKLGKHAAAATAVQLLLCPTHLICAHGVLLLLLLLLLLLRGLILVELMLLLLEMLELKTISTTSTTIAN